MIKKTKNIIELRTLCFEHKIDPRDARVKLRLAVKDANKFPELAKTYKPRQPWQWGKDSTAHKEAVKAIND
jgi:hypothetical protein